MANELKPCPFCGGSKLETYYCDIEGWIAHIKCLECDDMIGPMSDYKYETQEDAFEDAAAKWNTRHPAPVEGLVDNCDGKEQEAFEAWAKKNNYDMHEHPMHYLFLDAKTYAARQGWSEAIRYCRSQAEAIIAAERAESDEAYELGKRDGYSEAVQEIDLKTGGDGEYRYCTDHDPERHTPDPESMIQRIVERFETLNTMESISEIKEWKRRANEAEAIIAAEIKRERDIAEKQLSEVVDRMSNDYLALKTDNAALTARVKELEAERNYAFSEMKNAKAYWNIETNHAEQAESRAEALETQLAAARDVLETVANTHANNPSDAMADMPEEDYVRHILYELRKLARASLEAKP